MHEQHARVLAWGIGAVVTAAALIFAGRGEPDAPRTPITTTPAASRPVPSEAATRGEALFVSLDCVRCHSFRGIGNPSGALDDAASRADPIALVHWITAAPEVADDLSRKARDAKAGYAELPRADLEALVEYLGAAAPN